MIGLFLPVFVILKNLIHYFLVFVLFGHFLSGQLEILGFAQVFGVGLVAHVWTLDHWVNLRPYVCWSQLLFYLEVRFWDLGPKLESKYFICYLDSLFLLLVYFLMIGFFFVVFFLHPSHIFLFLLILFHALFFLFFDFFSLSFLDLDFLILLLLLILFFGFFIFFIKHWILKCPINHLDEFSDWEKSWEVLFVQVIKAVHSLNFLFKLFNQIVQCCIFQFIPKKLSTICKVLFLII